MWLKFIWNLAGLIRSDLIWLDWIGFDEIQFHFTFNTLQLIRSFHECCRWKSLGEINTEQSELIIYSVIKVVTNEVNNYTFYWFDIFILTSKAKKKRKKMKKRPRFIEKNSSIYIYISHNSVPKNIQNLQFYLFQSHENQLHKYKYIYI